MTKRLIKLLTQSIQNTETSYNFLKFGGGIVTPFTLLHKPLHKSVNTLLPSSRNELMNRVDLSIRSSG